MTAPQNLLYRLKNQLYHLRQATSGLAATKALLGEVAERKVVLDTHSHQQMVAYLSAIRQELQLLDHTPQRMVAINPDALPDTWGALPDSLQASYLRLYEMVYGTRALVTDSNPRAKSARQQVLNDGHTRRIGPMTQAPKSSTASKRNTIIDHKAWEFKRGVDRQLKDVTAAIRAFTSARSSSHRDRQAAPPAPYPCQGSRCSRLLSPQWSFCPWCGTVGRKEEESSNG